MDLMWKDWTSIVNNSLQKYRSSGFEDVNGWCSVELFPTIDILNSARINKKGGCCEIGVHHGKFYILLNQTIESHETSFAIDVFERQDLNIDYSGAGALEVFRSNLEKYDVHRGANTRIITGDSTDYGLRLVETIGYASLRFMSIDGGHTVEHTLNDLKLANKTISNEGVVILDDILNAHWLGVIEGVSRFLSTRPTLVPFAIGHNKLFLAKLSFRDFYFKLFAQTPQVKKIVGFFGHSIVAI